MFLEARRVPETNPLYFNADPKFFVKWIIFSWDISSLSDKAPNHWRIQGAIRPWTPFQSYDVANTATFPFEATSKHNRNIQQTRNI